MTLSSLRDRLKPKLIFPSLSIGLISGIESTAVNVALALMIFSGDLSAHLGIGLSILFLGSAIHYLITAAGSSYPGTLSSVQDGPAVILSVIIAALLAGMPLASPETKFYTALAGIMITSLTTGLVCWLLGKFKLGGLVSYIPYPVIGGFLAGTGILLLLGGLQVMTGKAVTLLTLGTLFQKEVLFLWVAGVGFAVILFALMQKVDHYLVLPGVLAAAVILFYLALGTGGVSLAQATRSGWLVNGASLSGSIFHFWNPAGFAHVDWHALLGQTGSLLACMVVSLISLLLNTTAMELSTDREMDLNSELKNIGRANLIAGATGSMIGFPILGDTALACRMGARRRLNGFFAAGVVGIFLVFGGGFLKYLPNLALGGILFYIGMDFLYTWLYQTWFRMPRWEYAVVLLIALLIPAIGFLQGVSLGLGLAVVMFVFRYSRTSSVRHTLSGVTYQSNMTRARPEAQFLHEHGDLLYILKLQGYIFFGTANQILEAIRSRLNGSGAPRYIVLDFQLVANLDSSATFSFVKIKRLVKARGIDLVLTHASPQIQRQLQNDLPAGEFRYFPDLDHGIEWCEENLLASFERGELLAAENSQLDQLLRLLPDREQQHLKPCFFEPGERIITEGCEQNSLYIIESGRVVIQTRGEDGEILRLRALEAGAFFGEIGLYSGCLATADVIAELPTRLYVLAANDLSELERTSPGVAAAVHRYVAAYLSERLAKSTTTIQALR